MFPESTITTFHCSKSNYLFLKCKIVPLPKNETVPFTISTDGSNDIGSFQQCPLATKTVVQ